MKINQWMGRKWYLLILLFITTVITSACQSNENKPSRVNQEGEIEEEVPTEYERVLGVIKNIDVSNKRVFVYQIEKEELIGLLVDGAVELENEYGEPITLNQLSIGDMVRTKYVVGEERPEFLHITAETWEYENVKDVQVDVENKTLKRGNDTFVFTDELVALYDGIPMDIGDITTIDKVTLKGYRDQVWVVILENGHGFVELKNHAFFIDGTLEIGFGVIETITETMKVPVQVGVYHVVIDKVGYDPVEREIMVEKGQNVVIDLSNEVPSEGEIKLTVIQEDAYVYINGQRYEDLSKAIKLPFGDYLVVAEKEGYSRYEDTVTLKEASLEYTIDMEKKAKYMHVNSPVNAEVYLDGDYIGLVPVSIPIEPGSHSVTLRQDGYYSKLYNIEILDDGKDSFFTFPDLAPME